MPRRPLCSEKPSNGSWHAKQSLALLQPYIQINPPRTALWLSFDVDRPAGGLAWQEANLPQPAWSCTTRKNGYGHLVYGLEVPVCGNDLSNKAVRYLEAIKEGYRSKLGADLGFAGLLTKNPRHPDWLVEIGLQKLWTLGELAEYVTLPSTCFLFRQEKQVGGLGRNCDTFDRLRFWAYRAIGDYRKKGEENWAYATKEKLEQLNELNSPPLQSNELKHILKSVSKWVWTKYEGTNGRSNKLASDLGKLGGRPRTTTREAKPWVLAGIHRSTWYRRKQASGKLEANATKASDSPSF